MAARASFVGEFESGPTATFPHAGQSGPDRVRRLLFRLLLYLLPAASERRISLVEQLLSRRHFTARRGPGSLAMQFLTSASYPTRARSELADTAFRSTSAAALRLPSARCSYPVSSTSPHPCFCCRPSGRREAALRPPPPRAPLYASSHIHCYRPGTPIFARATLEYPGDVSRASPASPRSSARGSVESDVAVGTPHGLR